MSVTWTETSSITFECPSFRVPLRTPTSSCHIAKSASLKLKLGAVIDLMLSKKQSQKVSPCLWCGLRHLKSHASALVSGWQHWQWCFADWTHFAPSENVCVATYVKILCSNALTHGHVQIIAHICRFCMCLPITRWTIAVSTMLQPNKVLVVPRMVHNRHQKHVWNAFAIFHRRWR